MIHLLRSRTLLATESILAIRCGPSLRLWRLKTKAIRRAIPVSFFSLHSSTPTRYSKSAAAGVGGRNNNAKCCGDLSWKQLVSLWGQFELPSSFNKNQFVYSCLLAASLLASVKRSFSLLVCDSLFAIVPFSP